MRVVIDAIPLLVRSAGVKNYLYYWIQHLRAAAGADTIRTFPSLGELSPLTHQHSVAGWWPTFSGLASLALANHAGIPPGGLSARYADIFHASSLLRTPPRHGRLTATIHDMTCWLMPELHPEANRRADRSFAEILKRADAVIAVSQSTKDDSVRVLGLAPEKITVIHSGVSQAFFDVPNDAIWRVKQRYGLARPFVLFIGTIEPRKNLDTLLDAYTSLEPALQVEYELVVAGPPGWATQKTMARLRGKGIRYLGYVPETDLAPLTAAATVFAYPSLYEGFGFPVAQAMAAGVPVITSNVSALPEITGNAALLVDPRSILELRNALTRLLSSCDLRAEQIERGRYYARGFRWDVCAAKSLLFFEKVL
ncbi:MAG TPA: glycosyltransferase family 1 protein [Bryobacteraceae bacterium]|jgi:glycosyltransferase involved in cell wall biosynthesis|nr:glycosyltransferase family 1 protein [Bryobacteraceae bacterium]